MLDGTVLLQSFQLAKNPLISTSIGGESIAVEFLNCQSPPDLAICHGQVVWWFLDDIKAHFRNSLPEPST